MEAETKEAGSGSLGYWGWALIACAFIKPIAEAVGGGNPAQAGERIAYIGMAFVVLVLFVGLAMRKRSTRAKGIGRIVVGIILIAISSLPASAESTRGTTPAEKQFLQESQALAASHLMDSQRLGVKFDAIDLDSMLTPANLASSKGLASLRKAVTDYRGLLDERMRMLYAQQADFEKFFNTRSPTDADRSAALASFQPGKQRNIDLYSGLDRTQRAFADAVSEIVEWSAKQSGHWALQGGKFLFESAAQQQQFLTFANKVRAAEAAANAAIVAGTATQKQMQADAQTFRQVQQEMLGK